MSTLVNFDLLTQISLCSIPVKRAIKVMNMCCHGKLCCQGKEALSAEKLADLILLTHAYHWSEVLLL